MNIVLIALTASTLLGLAIGLVFRVWIMAPIALLVAFASAIVLHSHGFGFVEGVLVTVACLFANQAAYLIAATLVSPAPKFLTGDTVDDDPGDDRKP